MKTKTFLLILMSALSLTFARANDYLPLQIDSDNTWSFIDQKGRICFQKKFQYVRSNVYENVFEAQEEGKSTALYFIGQKGIVKIAGNLKRAGICDGGVIPVIREGKKYIEVINRQGKQVFKLDSAWGEKVVECEAMFHNGFLHFETEYNVHRFQKSKHQGLVNAKGKVVLEGKYVDVYALNNNTIYAREKDGKIKVFDGEGNFIKDVPYCCYNIYLKHGSVGIYKTGQKKYIQVFTCDDSKTATILLDERGNLVTDSLPYYSIDEIPTGFIRCQEPETGNYGVLNTDFEVVVPFKFQFIEFASQGIFARRAKILPYEFYTYSGEYKGTEWCSQTGLKGNQSLDELGSFVVVRDGEKKRKEEQPWRAFIYNNEMKLIYDGPIYDIGDDHHNFYVSLTVGGD